jgi:hypothetical protein
MNSTPSQNNSFERALEEARLKLEINKSEQTPKINSFATSSVSERMKKDLEDLLS